MSAPKVICLTPIKNEAWILERFLKCASLWADHIIIADQGSDDGSREIASRFPKVMLLENSSKDFNEPERQKLLISAARSIPGPRLLIALDADEFLTAKVLTSHEWDSVLRAPAGTVIRFEWAIILDDISSYWIFPHEFAFGFMDDGSDHVGQKIHSPRLPIPAKAPEICLKEIKNMHFLVEPFRLKSRLRWYQCWMLLKQPHQRPVEIFRFHNKDLNIPTAKIKTMPKEWLLGYQGRGIDMTSVPRQGIYRWDKEVLDLFVQHGTKRFRKLAIWDRDWNALYQEVHGSPPPVDLSDPRTLFDRAVHRWLRSVQPYFSHYGPPHTRLRTLYFRMFRKLLRIAGW